MTSTVLGDLKDEKEQQTACSLILACTRQKQFTLKTTTKQTITQVL